MTLYDILGVDNDADRCEIEQAYRKRVKEVHPDTGGSAEKFKQVKEAKEVLTDSEGRKEYDEWLQEEESKTESDFEKVVEQTVEEEVDYTQDRDWRRYWLRIVAHAVVVLFLLFNSTQLVTGIGDMAVVVILLYISFKWWGSAILFSLSAGSILDVFEIWEWSSQSSGELILFSILCGYFAWLSW